MGQSSRTLTRINRKRGGSVGCRAVWKCWFAGLFRDAVGADPLGARVVSTLACTHDADSALKGRGKYKTCTSETLVFDIPPKCRCLHRLHTMQLGVYSWKLYSAGCIGEHTIPSPSPGFPSPAKIRSALDYNNPSVPRDGSTIW